MDSILKYSLNCLYASSGGRLSIDYPKDEVETITTTLPSNTESVMAEFLSPAGFVFLPGIWDAKVTMRATGQQPEKYAFYRLEVLQNGERVCITNYQPLSDTFQSLVSEVFLPGHKYKDRLLLRIWVKNAHTNTHTNTFELDVNQNKRCR